MYNAKDILFVGKHDYDRKSAEKFASWGGDSFSINIFQWGLKSNGKEMKPLKCSVRVSGSPVNKDNVFSVANHIVKQLDAGTWSGKKFVRVK